MKIFKFNYLIRTALILIFFSIFFLFGAYAHKYGLIGFLKVNIIEIPNIVSKIYNAQRNKYGSKKGKKSPNGLTTITSKVLATSDLINAELLLESDSKYSLNDKASPIETYAIGRFKLSLKPKSKVS